ERFVDAAEGGPARTSRSPGDEGQPVTEATLRVLLREQERPPPERVHEHRVGVLPDLREVRRVVLHVERHPDLLDDLATAVLERLVEPADRLPAERVVEA